MSEREETPAQRQARIRRQKREANINANAADRLDKITRLSGRTAETMRNETSPLGSGTSTPSVTTPQVGSAPQQRGLPPMPEASTEEQARMQEEYLRALLRGPPGNGNDGEAEGQPPLSKQEDPMMKMLGSLMSGVNGTTDPDNPGAPPFNPEELSKAFGIPSFLTNMVMGSQKAPPTAAEAQSTRLWRIFHVIFAMFSGLHHLLAISWAEDSFGPNPPAPATFQNPFVLFVLGELLLQSARILTAGPAGKRGPGLWIQVVKEIAGDGALVVFLLGVATWWKGG